MTKEYDVNAQDSTMNVDTLIDRALIADVVLGLANGQDDKDWPALRSLLADHVMLDLSDHMGGSHVQMTGDELVEMCRSTIGGFDALQHATTAPLITFENGRAQCRVNLTAFHRLATQPGIDDYFTMRGSWMLELAKVDGAWLVVGWKVVRRSGEGFAGLYDLAREVLTRTSDVMPTDREAAL